MISKALIEDTLRWQLKTINNESYQRTMMTQIDGRLQNFAYIVTGIRRCGKSTLMQQIIKRQQDESLYINFDTPALFGFEMGDFRLMDAVIEEHRPKWLFFDEIQVIKGWEVYVRSKLDQGYRVFITGSNASMLSQELGTHLTGRHISYALYPFSYSEFLGFLGLQASPETLKKYMVMGGFPEYLKTNEPRILTDLTNDILYRDILVRYNLRDEAAMKNLLVFLMGNIGNLVSANKLTSVIGVNSAATVADYFTYLSNSYLVQFLPKFSYSYKIQIRNPKKVYSIDLGLHSVMTPSFTHDSGRKLENIVFLELLRRDYELYYFNENQHECDFVLCRNHHPEGVVQVCEKLTAENEIREIEGLKEAMRNLNLDHGLILTLDQDDLLYDSERKIEVKPLWKWLTRN